MTRSTVVVATVAVLLCLCLSVTALPKFPNGPGGDSNACEIAKQKLADCRANKEKASCSIEAEASKNVCKCVDNPCWHFSNAGEGTDMTAPRADKSGFPNGPITPESVKEWENKPFYPPEKKKEAPAASAAPKAAPAKPLPEGKTDEERRMEEAEKQLKARGAVIKPQNRLPKKVYRPENYLPKKPSTKAYPLPKMNLAVPPLSKQEAKYVRLPTPRYSSAQLKQAQRKIAIDRRNQMLANLEPDVVPESPYCHYCRESVTSQIGSVALLQWCLSQMHPDLCQHVVYSVDESFRQFTKGKNIIDPVILRQESLTFSQHSDAVCKTFCANAKV
eukprot:TRINITY_DN815_c0_g1_i1.p1 TRINITY_DN815_c0_g1~~TRINITY_DN815_c0_g1_i1.p1  ORF type:complete len:332 (-),score=90.10 TRINITY_DN815_c0_g1_i1:548-1543(-)